MEWAGKTALEKAPAWCSADLAYGSRNMAEDARKEFFRLLAEFGFREIAVGCPAVSDADFHFARQLAEQDIIPPDTAVQVRLPARESLAEKTLEAVRGLPRVIIDLGSGGSDGRQERSMLQDKKSALQAEAEAAGMLPGMAQGNGQEVVLEYSPPAAIAAEPDFLLDMCDAVLDVWKPSAGRKAVINLTPSPFHAMMPHQFASLVEYLDRRLACRENCILSVHPRDDRGHAASMAEMSVLAGAQRIEGSLFGQGGRLGDAGIVTLALNLFSSGADPGLALSVLPALCRRYERLTGMQVPERLAHRCELFFPEFSPASGRESGISGNDASSLLRQNYGIIIPEKMHGDLEKNVKQRTAGMHAELSPETVLEIFEDNYLYYNPFFKIEEFSFRPMDGIIAEAVIACGGRKSVFNANGNGRLDAVSNIIKQYFNISYELTAYEEYALSRGSSSRAMAFVCATADGTPFWGAGSDEDIVRASIQALVAAVNKLPFLKPGPAAWDERLIAMQNYIQTHYQTATLAEIAAHFHLSVPYASRYIREKSGRTFGEIITDVRMKKAKSLLSGGNLTVETVSYAIGYPNVEHFTRLFKKKFGITPARFRNRRAG